MATMYFEDGYSKKYDTKKGTIRLHGIKRNGQRPVKIELDQDEWDNKEFHYGYACNAVKPIVGIVTLKEDIDE